MILDFEINGVKYDYRKDAPGADGVYKLDVEKRGYVPVDIIPAEVQTEVDRLLAIEVSTQFQRDRAEAHIPLQDQIDMLYWDKKNSTNTHSEYTDAIKLAYPKP
jgi:hypothetical protein